MKFFLLMAIAVSVWGCTERPHTEFAADTEVTFIDDAGIEEIIKNRNGKILFVNVWATWCVPCIEEFPDLVKIYNEFNGREFDFLSLSVDFGDRPDSLVRSFLVSQHADFPVYIIKEKSSESTINLLNQEWNGAIPATFIYDETGTRKSFILGAQSYSFFKQSIDSLLQL